MVMHRIQQTRKNMNDKLYSITELAEEFDITPRAIRFYETKTCLHHSVPVRRASIITVTGRG